MDNNNMNNGMNNDDNMNNVNNDINNENVNNDMNNNENVNNNMNNNANNNTSYDENYYNNVVNNSTDANNGYNNMNNNYNMQVLNSPIIKKFNWSAFADTLFWGIGNKAYISLLVLVPFLGIIWKFVAGFKGNEWAWQAGNYSSLEEFEKVQETWNRAGIARFIVNTFGIIAVTIIWIFVIAAAAATTGMQYNSYGF